jgi:hypothetical protein
VQLRENSGGKRVRGILLQHAQSLWEGGVRKFHEEIIELYDILESREADKVLMFWPS